MLFLKTPKKRAKKTSEVRRSGTDRRSSADGRRLFDDSLFSTMDPDRRKWKERRSPSERRNGWERVSDWSSSKITPEE